MSRQAVVGGGGEGDTKQKYLGQPPHEYVSHEQEHERGLPRPRLVRAGGDVDGGRAEVEADVVVGAVV